MLWLVIKAPSRPIEGSVQETKTILVEAETMAGAITSASRHYSLTGIRAVVQVQEVPEWMKDNIKEQFKSA